MDLKKPQENKETSGDRRRRVNGLTEVVELHFDGQVHIVSLSSKGRHIKAVSNDKEWAEQLYAHFLARGHTPS